MAENKTERFVWVDRWLSGGTPESRHNVPVLYVLEDDEETER
jgi:hypothetical protein